MDLVHSESMNDCEFISRPSAASLARQQGVRREISTPGFDPRFPTGLCPGRVLPVT